MPLVTAPLFTLNAQYRPNVFVLSMTSSDPLVLAQASIVVDMVGVTSMQKAPAYNIGTTYYFVFDVAKVLQTYSAPKGQNKTTIFPNTLNVPLGVQNTDIHSRVGLIVSYYYNNPTTGLLTQFATTDTVTTGYPAIAATRQTRDWNNMGLVDYVMPIGTPTGKFLTNCPRFYPICTTENWYLTFVPNISNTVRIITQDSAGVGIDTGLFSITASTNLFPYTIGAGMVNLASQTYFDGSVNMSDPNIAQYQIQVGNAYLFGSSWIFVANSEIMTVQVERDCCADRRVRLHWFNRLGGADAYTFSSKKKIEEKTKSDTAQKPLSWATSIPPATSYDKGIFKIHQETAKEYEVESTFYTEADGAWIAELLSSPEVYLETADGLIAVVISDSKITLSENDELLNVTIQFTEANYISVQSN